MRKIPHVGDVGVMRVQKPGKSINVYKGQINQFRMQGMVFLAVLICAMSVKRLVRLLGEGGSVSTTLCHLEALAYEMSTRPCDL